jgi:hypothetical protein
MRRLDRLTLVLLLLVTGACTTLSTQSTAPSRTPADRSPSAEASEGAAIPEELVGEWASQKGSDPVTLTLGESGSYVVTRGVATGRGAVTALADGSRLDFFGGDPCSGRGSYEWSIEGDALDFTPVGEDECPGRTAVLDELIYTRAE